MNSTLRARTTVTALVAVLVFSLGAAAEIPAGAKVLPLGESGSPWQAVLPGVQGGTFRSAMFGNPRTWNPLTSLETSSTTVTNLLYHGLVTLNPITADVEPALAASWRFSDDGRTVTFVLREGLRWSDGEPLTADDVLFTYNDVISNPAIATTARDGLRLSDGTMPTIEKVDDRTIRVTASVPYRPLLTAMGKRILPRHKWASAVAAIGRGEAASFLGLDTPPHDVVGTGPYALERFVPDQAVFLKRNPHYYVVDRRGTQLPYYDERVLRIESSSDLSLLHFMNGELDAYEPLPADLPLLAASAARRGYTVLVDRTTPVYGSSWLCLNQDIGSAAGTDAEKRGLYRTIEFRHAVAHLVDKRGMVDALFHGLGLPQWSPVSIGSPYYAGRDGYAGPITETDAVTFPYDPALAARILDDLGLVDQDGDGWREFPSGDEATFTLATAAGQTDYEGQCLVFAESARSIGLDVRYAPQDVNLLLLGLFTGGFDIVLLGFNGGVDPNMLASAYTPCGRMHFWSRETCAAPSDADLAMADAFRAGAATLDPDLAFVAYREMQRAAAWEANLIYTVYPSFRFAYYEHVGNASMANPNGHPCAENGFAADIAYDRRRAP